MRSMYWRPALITALLVQRLLVGRADHDEIVGEPACGFDLGVDPIAREGPVFVEVPGRRERLFDVEHIEYAVRMPHPAR